MREISQLPESDKGDRRVPNPQVSTDNPAEPFSADPAGPKNSPEIHNSSQTRAFDAPADTRRPAPRYCTERWDDEGGDAVVCRAALSDGLRCTVCSGAKCYAHCGSVDHYVDAEPYAAVRVGDTRAVRVVRTPGGLYCGHLAVFQADGAWHVLVRQSSLEADRVFDELFELAQEGYSDPGDDEPDGDLPADDQVPESEPEMSHNIDLRSLGLYERHVPLVDALVRTMLDPLAALPADVIECLAVIAIDSPHLAIDLAGSLIGSKGKIDAGIRSHALRLALGIVGGATDCGCPECAPIAKTFSHLIEAAARE